MPAVNYRTAQLALASSAHLQCSDRQITRLNNGLMETVHKTEGLSGLDRHIAVGILNLYRPR